MPKEIYIISDTHANLEATDAVLEAIGKDKKIISLGDTFGYGPNPIEVGEKVFENCCMVLLGNHDDLICKKSFENVHRWAIAGLCVSMKALGLSSDDFVVTDTPLSKKPNILRRLWLWIKTINVREYRWYDDLWPDFITVFFETFIRPPKAKEHKLLECLHGSSPEGSIQIDEDNPEKGLILFYHASPSDEKETQLWDYLMTKVRVEVESEADDAAWCYLSYFHSSKTKKAVSFLSEKRPRAKITFVGHTHSREILRWDADGKLQSLSSLEPGTKITIDLNDGYQYLINPGAVGQSRDYNPGEAAYIHMTTHADKIEIAFKSARYDENVTAEKLKKLECYYYGKAGDGKSVQFWKDYRKELSDLGDRAINGR